MKRAILAAVMAAVVTGAASTHPHVFIDTRIEVSFDHRGVAGFWVTWRFDRAFTASILMDFDRDKNGRLSAAEVAEVQANAFSNLVNYKYFVYIRSPNGLHRPSSVRDFSAYVEGERVHYRFFVPYPFTMEPGEAQLNLAVYDDTFFCDIGYDEAAPVRFTASESLSGKYAIREDRGIRIDYPANDGSQGSTFPRQVVMTLQRKP